MKTIIVTVLLVAGISSASSGQIAGRPDKRVILTSDCFQLLQDDPPRPGDIYPEHIDVAFLDRWCPFGLTARYNKAVSLEELKAALEKRYGKGTTESWPNGPAVTWEVESAHVLVVLDTADKRMAENQHVEEGTKSIHYHDTSNGICPVR
jgi:hypothetical protein